MDSINQNEVKAEDVVYVIYHNPHTPTVANIKAAEIVQHPNDPNKLALFLNESFHLIEEDDALFSSEATANKAFNDMYGDLL
jgi:transcriptional regulator of the spore photoproduct lyase operon